MAIPSNGITAEVIRGVMPLYTLSPDLLAGTLRALAPPPADATTAWRHARLARLAQEIGGLMPADAPQARIAADIVIVREAADDTFARSFAPELTVVEFCRLRRVAGELKRTGATLERGLARRQAVPAPFFGRVEADAVDIGALDAVWCKGTAAGAVGQEGAAPEPATAPGDPGPGIDMAGPEPDGAETPDPAAPPARAAAAPAEPVPDQPEGAAPAVDAGGSRAAARSRRTGRCGRSLGGLPKPHRAPGGTAARPRRGRRRGWKRGRAGRSTSCGPRRAGRRAPATRKCRPASGGERDGPAWAEPALARVRLGNRTCNSHHARFATRRDDEPPRRQGAKGRKAGSGAIGRDRGTGSSHHGLGVLASWRFIRPPQPHRLPAEPATLEPATLEPATGLDPVGRLTRVGRLSRWCARLHDRAPELMASPRPTGGITVAQDRVRRRAVAAGLAPWQWAIGAGLAEAHTPVGAPPGQAPHRVKPGGRL